MFTGIVQACAAVSSTVRPAQEPPLETLAQGLRLKIDSAPLLGADWRGNTWSWAWPESRPQTQVQLQVQPRVQPTDAVTRPAAKTVTGAT